MLFENSGFENSGESSVADIANVHKQHVHKAL